MQGGKTLIRRISSEIRGGPPVPGPSPRWGGKTFASDSVLKEGVAPRSLVLRPGGVERPLHLIQFSNKGWPPGPWSSAQAGRKDRCI